MELIELTAQNINTYLKDCIEVQRFLIKPEEEIDGEQFIATASAEHSYFVAILEDGRIAGLGVVNKIVHPIRTNAYIDNIVVHEDFRGRGYFAVLMDELEKKAIAWGATQAKLTCSREMVQPLYERRGYKEKDTKYYCKPL